MLRGGLPLCQSVDTLVACHGLMEGGKQGNAVLHLVGDAALRGES